MLSLTRVGLGASLTLTLLLLGTGCADNKVKAENEALRQQNKSFENELKATQAQLADTKARADAAALATAPTPAPETPALPPEKPASEDKVKTARGEDVISLPGDVLFDLGKATLKPSAKTQLAKIATTLKTKYAGHEFRVVGHTDSTPVKTSGWDDNWDLGAARARAVTLYLISQGVPKKSFTVASRADNDVKPGKNLAANRRVDIVVVK